MDFNQDCQYVYLPNAEQYSKFQKIQSFFADYVKQEGGTVSEVDGPPQNMDATITVAVDSIDFYGDMLKRFTNVFKAADMMRVYEIDEETVGIDVTVKGVWEVVRTE